MKWTWDQLGFPSPDGDPADDLQAIFARLFPEVADGSLKIVSSSRGADELKVIVAGSPLEAIDVATLRQLAAKLGVQTIQVIPWHDDPQSLISHALQPAEVERVLLCDLIGRAIVVARQDQCDVATGPRGQNARSASQLCGWDIEIMTAGELQQQTERALAGFSQLAGLTAALAQQLVAQGILSYEDLSLVDPAGLMELGGLTADQVERIIQQAEHNADDDIFPGS